VREGFGLGLWEALFSRSSRWFVNHDIPAAPIPPDPQQGLFLGRLFVSFTASSADFTGLRLISWITSPGCRPASADLELGPRR